MNNPNLKKKRCEYCGLHHFAPGPETLCQKCKDRLKESIDRDHDAQIMEKE